MIWEQRRQGPSTHALVIGVGLYPHLQGGTGVRSSQYDGMGQLTSPPASARGFANWVIGEFRNPNKPLASVSLLLSEAPRRPFTNPRTGNDVDIEPATIDNVRASINDWVDRGDTDEGNLLLFYFCGHGISQGPDYALLLEDFGADPRNALDGAIDFRQLHLGMETCVASQQCFFVDACRSSSDTLIETQRYAGRVIIQPGPRPVGLAPREPPIFYAALSGHDAYARPNSVSLYTEALLAALKGAGADDAEGDWRIDTTQLHRALDFFMRRAGDSGQSLTQVPQSGNHSTFFLHYLRAKPKSPVLVRCAPDQALEHANLDCRVGATSLHQRQAATIVVEPPAWNLSLEVGKYEFSARFPDGRYHDAARTVHVRPPYRKVLLEVQP